MTLSFITISASFFSFILSIYYVFNVYRTRKPKRRIEKWFENPAIQKRRSVFLLLGDQFDDSLLAEEIDKKLKVSAVPLKPSEYVAILFIAFILLWVIGHWILALMFPVDVLVSLLVVRFGSGFYLKSRREKRSAAFNEQLPEICRMLSNTVKAGLTLQQGIEMAGKELKAPAGPEFTAMSHQLNMGDNFDRVIHRFMERVDSREVKVMMNTILIQRRIGGNLAEVLEMMAQTLEERGRVYKEMSAVTAESKYVAFILPILPIATAIMLNVFIPGFLNPLFTPLGLILLGVFAMMLIISSFIIKKVTDIRV